MAAPPIFVVDDDTDLREVLGELLTEEGWAPQLCSNGRAALDLLRGGARPRAILLDLMMPEMDGWQFRREQLRDAALRDIPVVVMTASPGLADTAALAAEVLEKPVGLAEILGALGRLALPA